MSRWKKFDDDDVPDDFVLPPGDVLRGRLLFKKHCAQCHVIEKDEVVQTGCTLLGPNLYGVYGRTAGTGPRTSLIDSSQAIKESGIVWTDITLMRYLKNPRQFTQHPMSMNFRGMDSWQDRVDLIWYIKAACDGTFESHRKALALVKTKLKNITQSNGGPNGGPSGPTNGASDDTHRGGPTADPERSRAGGPSEGL